MKKRIIYLLLLSCSILLLSSCKKWLDVKPQDKFTESQIFSTASSAYQALNGIYLSMSKSNVYGANLTMLVPELLAQEYNASSNHAYYPFATYNFTDNTVRSKIEDIWTSSYLVIANTNSFIGNLDKYKGVVTPSQDSILRGEAYGIRACLHFDLLRLFGPMFSSADSVLPSIPYYSQLSTSYKGYLPANNVMDSILTDLSRAENLLAQDPIITFGIGGNTDPNTDAFFKRRNLRMNYYAVKALQARVNLYRGAKSAAYEAAQFVIQRAQPLFPWIVPGKVLSEKDNPDRAFSTEMIFAVESLDLYGNYNRYYNPNLSASSILAPLDNRLKAIYEDPTNVNDYRYNPDWIYPAASSKNYRTFFKFADLVDPATSFRYRMPLVRMSEMYYIAAECAPDNTTAFDYLNTVRNNRGLVNLALTANLATEIKKEYNKEFYGEGQLFYYYKRTKATTIPNGAATSGNVTMDKTKYVLPLPQSETDFH